MSDLRELSVTELDEVAGGWAIAASSASGVVAFTHTNAVAASIGPIDVAATSGTAVGFLVNSTSVAAAG